MRPSQSSSPSSRWRSNSTVLTATSGEAGSSSRSVNCASSANRKKLGPAGTPAGGCAPAAVNASKKTSDPTTARRSVPHAERGATSRTEHAGRLAHRSLGSPEVQEEERYRSPRRTSRPRTGSAVASPERTRRRAPASGRSASIVPRSRGRPPQRLARLLSPRRTRARLRRRGRACPSRRLPPRASGSATRAVTRPASESSRPRPPSSSNRPPRTRRTRWGRISLTTGSAGERARRTGGSGRGDGRPRARASTCVQPASRYSSIAAMQSGGRARDRLAARRAASRSPSPSPRAVRPAPSPRRPGASLVHARSRRDRASVSAEPLDVLELVREVHAGDLARAVAARVAIGLVDRRDDGAADVDVGGDVLARVADERTAS